MSDSSAVPVRRVDDPRQPKVKPEVNAAALPSISPVGPRKLVRPRLPEGYAAPRGIAPVLTHPHRWPATATQGESSHAEAFYFQKQINSKTSIIFLLEDGERIEGTIEWYDRNAVKVRHGATRTLIYKAAIKYLYKAGDAHQVNGRL